MGKFNPRTSAKKKRMQPSSADGFVHGEEVSVESEDGRKSKKIVYLCNQQNVKIDWKNYACMPSYNGTGDGDASIVRLVRYKALSPTEKLVFFGLVGLLDKRDGLARGNPSGTCSGLARMLEIDNAKISRALAALERENLVFPAADRAGWVLNPAYAATASHRRAHELWNAALDQQRRVQRQKDVALAVERAKALAGANPTREDLEDAAEDATDYDFTMAGFVLDAIDRQAARALKVRTRGRPRKVQPDRAAAIEKAARDLLAELQSRAVEDAEESEADD